MRIILALLSISLSMGAQSQTLTIEKIMQDRRWIGTSPSNPLWSYDSKTVYFNWNPDKAASDSAYGYTVSGKTISKINYNDARQAEAMNNGVYNHLRNRLVYSYKGDIYLVNIAINKTTRITKTAAYESSPLFVDHDEWIVYTEDNNLFAWSIQTGMFQQLTYFQKENAPVKKTLSGEEQWTQQQQLQTSEIIRQRKEKKDQRKAFLERSRDADTLHVIYTGDKEVQSLQISPDARFITYVLYEKPANKKNTIVPSYVTENGFTTDIETRPKAGAPQGKYTLFVFDRMRDTVIAVKTDSLEGITNQPDYVKDYPQKFKDQQPALREVVIQGLYWNETGSAAVVDILSQDFKDRWLMQLDTATAKLKTIDHQRDEAWIAGPGIAWLGASVNGWINDHTFYYQSEVSGYAHLYTCDINTGTKKQITQGNYEVQWVYLNNSKQFFYLITNEEHPGKQNLVRIKTDGTQKEKLTAMDGGYDAVSLSPDEKYIAYRYSYQNKPWELYIQENAHDKKAMQVTSKAMSGEWKAYPWRDTKIFTFTARDGKPVYARIYEPAAGKKNNAAIIFVHGAGYLQNVTYGWSYYYHEFMFNNLLADKGYTVMDIDYRASSGYGRDWRTGIYRYMGGKDLDDEVDAAKYLVQNLGIDSTRIGMYGGSYGGFMTLMAMFTQPSVFKAGAALRPVTDWGHYDDSYTSAILNQPYNDSIAYQRSSPINFAGGLQNHLLICHGMVDVNVHYQDAVRLAQRLIELGKDNWELASYPVEDHGFVEPSSWADEYKRILKLFDENLLK